MAGSGRGNVGVSVVDDPNRPDCPKCAGFMRSKGNRWCCTSCKKEYLKNGIRNSIINKEMEKDGYDREAAEAYAKSIEGAYEMGCKSFVITSAQNNTPAFKAFLESLHIYCKYKKAKLIIIPVHYRNVTAWQQGDVKHFDSYIEPYLVHGDISLGHLLIRSHVRLEAPSANPLMGKQAHGGDKWIVFGNPQHRLEPVATPADLIPKKMFTTGSCTKKNYSESDRGEKAKFNHIFGALSVNFVKGSNIPFVRQLNSDDKGSFYDLDKRFSPKGFTSNHNIESLTTGDEHELWNIVKNPTYNNKNSIVKKLKPKYIVRHDLLDGYARSHHHEKSPLKGFSKWANGLDDYREEIERAIDFVNRTTPRGSTTLFVPSNHNDHLDQWLDRANPNKDFTNFELIHELRALQAGSVRKGEDKNSFSIVRRA